MLSKKYKAIDIGLIILFLSSFVCFLFWVLGMYVFSKPRYIYGHNLPHSGEDTFDSSLLRLNTLDKLTDYCDSVQATTSSYLTYPDVVSEAIRRKFYHNYSYYHVYNNAMGIFLSTLTGEGSMAVVIPDDIVKYPFAACSQQSIVSMEILKKKGYPVRKVSMLDSVTRSGHFAYEAYYDKGWHFFDTDQEPDEAVLRKYNQPSSAFLVAHPEIIIEAYHKRDDPQLSKRLLMSNKLGPVNKFPAPNAYLFQVVTKYFTRLGFLFFLALIFVRYKIRKERRNLSGLATVKRKEIAKAFS